MEQIQGTLGSNDSMMKMKNKLYSHSLEGKGRHKMYIKWIHFKISTSKEQTGKIDVYAI